MLKQIENSSPSDPFELFAIHPQKRYSAVAI